LIIGAARAATTTLWATLRAHPDVYMTELKETHYLLGGEWARRGQAWYESLFSPGQGALHRGEASTGYSMFPMFLGVPERAAALVPNVRIIYMIRHPVQRMVSHWVQATTSGQEHRPLEEAVVWGSAYYFTSCYGLQLSRWLEHFPRESVLVVRSEDLSADGGSTLDRILEHLDLPPWRPPSESIRENATESKLRARAWLVHASGALRGAGLEALAVRTARRSLLKRRLGLLRPNRPSELELDPTRAQALLECFRADFGSLRALVGDELDLYGLA
jgi:hypothetical protein